MPKTATPRKPETVSSKLAETRATSKNRSLSSLLGIGDNEKRLATDLGSGLNDVIGRGTIAGLLGLPGDLGGAAENGLRSLLGLPQVTPYGGSEHIGQKLEQAGLVSSVRRPKTELLASLISPAQAATAGYKAPQMARAGVKALDNLSAPRTMGRQQGAIENLWHGSPHTFDRFDLSKIGTGEGAQAYGHGAYLAESPDVAKAYREKLSADRFSLSEEATQGNRLSADLRDVVAEKQSLNGMEEFSKGAAARIKELSEKEASLRGEIQRLAKISDEQMAGQLYQTRLAWPDAREATDPLSPDHFLHWDKPLSEQAAKDKVVQAFKARGFDDWQIESMLNRGITGEQASVYLGGINGSETGAKSLLDAGVPGIRYLDAGSRGAGAGSHNYVVFDDKLIDIVSRNGQPPGLLGKMVAPQDEALRVAQAEDAKPEGLQIVWDRNSKIGGTSNQAELDYFGFERNMKPSEFRSYVPSGVWNKDTRDFILEAAKRGDSVAPPFLTVDWDSGAKAWKVIRHEGRSRTDAAAMIDPDSDIPVSMIPRGLRAKDITEEMRRAPIIGEQP